LPPFSAAFRRHDAIYSLSSFSFSMPSFTLSSSIFSLPPPAFSITLICHVFQIITLMIDISLLFH